MGTADIYMRGSSQSVSQDRDVFYERELRIGESSRKEDSRQDLQKEGGPASMGNGGLMASWKRRCLLGATMGHRIVDDSYESTSGYNFIRSPTLFLPTASSLREISSPRDMLAAAQAPSGALQEVISGFDAFYAVTRGVFPAYSGEHRFSLMNEWRDLSKTAEGSAKILRLVWTDIMASGTVGTNLRASPADGSRLENDQRQINAYSRQLTYDMRYAIPVLLLLAMWLSLIVIGSIASVIQRHPFQRLKMLLNDTSVGRYAATALYPASKGMLRATSNRWLDGVGYIPVKLGEEPTHTTFQSYGTPSEPERGEKIQNTPFVQPLMRNDSLEGVSTDPASHKERGKPTGH